MGLADLALGAYNERTVGSWGGAVYLVAGQHSGLSGEINVAEADAKLLTEAASDRIGSVIAGAGDVNGAFPLQQLRRPLGTHRERWRADWVS